MYACRCRAISDKTVISNLTEQFNALTQGQQQDAANTLRETYVTGRQAKANRDALMNDLAAQEKPQGSAQCPSCVKDSKDLFSGVIDQLEAEHAACG